MSKQFDRASDLEEQFRAEAERVARAPVTLPPIGRCYFCHESLGGNLKFCDSDCRDGHDHEQARKKACGR